MPKIALACNSLGMGGVETFGLDFIKGIKKLGKYDIVVIAVCGGVLEKEYEEATEVKYGGWKEQYQDIDIIVNNATGHGYANSKVCKIPCINVLHSKYCFNIPKNVEYNVTVNNQLRKWLLKINPETRDSSGVIHLGVDTEYFKPVEEDDIVSVGACGRLASVKRLAAIVKPFAKVFGNENAKLLFIGEGEDETFILGEAEKYGVKDKLEITKFIKNVPAYLSRIDIYCSVSSYESFSISTLEAMAMGKSIVATKTDGICELLTNSSAILFDVNSQDLDKNITSAFNMLKLTEQRKTYQLNARKRAELFSRDIMIEKYDTVITRLLG